MFPKLKRPSLPVHVPSSSYAAVLLLLLSSCSEADGPDPAVSPSGSVPNSSAPVDSSLPPGMAPTSPMAMPTTPVPDATGGMGGAPNGPGEPNPVSGGAGGESGGGAGGEDPGTLHLTPSAELLSECTGSGPINCRFDKPNGNYRVTVELGSDTEAGNTSVQAEIRRMVGGPFETAAGETVLHTFAVNVRDEKHDGYSMPANELNLRFTGPAPKVKGIAIEAADDLPTIFVVGDSTVCDWPDKNAPETGWAQPLSSYLYSSIAVMNLADSGDTASSLLKFFNPIKDQIQEGDFVFIQFGHNDQKNTDTVNNYKSNLMVYIDAARSAGATPLLFTPVARRGNTDFGGLDERARELAASENIPLIDLTKLADAFYKTVPDATALFMPGDGTHFNEAGAPEIARIVVEQLRALEPELSPGFNAHLR